MALYTNDDFIKAAQGAGLYDQFSDADLRLAQQNPDFGMYALQMKQDYANATTPEARALANGNLETARMQMGGYTGGSDGSQFNPLLNNGMGNSQLAMSINQYTGMGAYPDAYKPLADQQMNQILNYKPFSYDATTDPLYQQYQQTYTREGNRAMQDTLGQVSARTGGLASSYAGQAAQQSYNQYMAALADKIPELYQQAYQRYADEYNRKLNGFDVINNNRNFDFNVFNSDRNNLATQIDILAGLDNTQYQRDKAAMDDARSRIQQYLSLGGDISTLPADLLAASGMTQQELGALAAGMRPRGSGGGQPVDKNGNLIDYDNIVGKNLVELTADNPELAQQLLLNNWDNLGYTEKFSLLQNIYGNDYGNNVLSGELARGPMSVYQTYLGANQPKQETMDAFTEGIMGIPGKDTATTYQNGAEMLNQYGYNSVKLRTPEQYAANPQVQYDMNGEKFATYDDYVQTTVDYIIRNGLR